MIVTRPLVPVKIIYRDGTERTIDNPADFPDPGGLLKVAKILEPTIRATIVAPEEYTGAIIELCTSHRGHSLGHTYLSAATAATGARITLIYQLPLSSIVTNFHSTLKSLSSGFASFDYEESEWVESDLVRMNILVNGAKVDALCSVMHRSVVAKEGRSWARKLKEVVDRQHYEGKHQALKRFITQNLLLILSFASQSSSRPPSARPSSHGSGSRPCARMSRVISMVVM